MLDGPSHAWRSAALTVALSLTAAGARGEPAETCALVARITSAQGTVEAKRAGGAQWVAVARDDGLCAGDEIRVGEKSRADVVHLDQTLLRLGANTTIGIEGPQEHGSAAVDMLKGVAHFLSRSPASLDVRTPFTVAGVRGTEFFVAVESDKTLLSVFDGTVVAANEAGSVQLTGGQSAAAAAGTAPTLRAVARPRDAVRWALHYPPVIHFRAEEFAGGTEWQRAVARSLDSWARGDLQQAFTSVQTVPPDVRDRRLFAYRASLLLAVGSVDEATVEIGRVLELDPNDGNALALRAILAVVQDEKTGALETARAAVAAAPRAAAAHIALSYAQQAGFDLDGARESLDRAVELEPENALAWARLAELRSSRGDLDDALVAARRAATLAPELSRTQTVLGFAHLGRVETAAARAAFEKAIASDQADPLPRLGRGLAEIRDGNMSAGSRELEIAASLDPNSSIVHSYLGKAYFEEKRTGLDERQYQVAKELDPLDPTPWFYDAIQKQTTNRPVEALHDFQKAIELNDNRAVYRSRLLLDADLAARSASLGRIYGDLGFQPLALVEGWKSVNVDPSNHSAHRFLADTYAALPRHEIARVSELLQSQLLQPINITPIQPRLAESDLFQVGSGGPAALAFNEFNPLFNRDRVTLQTTGVLGENRTAAGEAVLAGIYRKASFSVGGSHFASDGFRENADRRDDLANAFLQGEISPETSVQAEYRYRNHDQGDLQLRFFPDDFRPDERQTAEIHTYRVGGRHAFSPASIFLASYIHQELDDTLEDRPPFPPIESIANQGRKRSDGGELQHLFRSRWANLVSGVGHVAVTGDDRLTTALALGNGTTVDEQTASRDLDHTNAYLYAYLALVRNVTLTAGVSGDVFGGDSATKERNLVNPKFGLTWNPVPNTTLRAAAFRALKRTLITDQTLEPTQVAGFNQFFDDGNGTESWRYGAAVDQKFSERLFAGIEYSARDLQVPFELIDPGAGSTSVREADWKEQLGRLYLLWAAHDRLALRAQYLYERFERDRDFTFGVRDVDTHRVPLGMGFFHPSGVSASVTGTYVSQTGEFEPNPGEFRSGSSDFFLVDAALGYRLPKRYGFVSVGVTNLFDKQFRYHDTDFTNPSIQPDRVFFARVTLALP